MISIVGTIIAMEHSQKPPKCVVTLQHEQTEKAFIEFRGRATRLLDPYTDNDEVCITLAFEGKVSSNTRTRFNNLVAKDIASFDRVRDKR